MEEEASDDEFELDNHDTQNETAEDNITNEGKTEQQIQTQKLARIEQKKNLKDRKETKPFAPIIVKAKKIWEELRKKNLNKKDRASLVLEMMDIVAGKAKDIIFKVCYVLLVA
jgi:pumilio family protein 6